MVEYSLFAIPCGGSNLFTTVCASSTLTNKIKLYKYVGGCKLHPRKRNYIPT
jgi:hypothetical protein